MRARHSAASCSLPALPLRRHEVLKMTERRGQGAAGGGMPDTRVPARTRPPRGRGQLLPPAARALHVSRTRRRRCWRGCWGLSRRIPGPGAELPGKALSEAGWGVSWGGGTTCRPFGPLRTCARCAELVTQWSRSVMLTESVSGQRPRVRGCELPGHEAPDAAGGGGVMVGGSAPWTGGAAGAALVLELVGGYKGPTYRSH